MNTSTQDNANNPKVEACLKNVKSFALVYLLIPVVLLNILQIYTGVSRIDSTNLTFERFFNEWLITTGILGMANFLICTIFIFIIEFLFSKGNRRIHDGSSRQFLLFIAGLMNVLFFSWVLYGYALSHSHAPDGCDIHSYDCVSYWLTKWSIYGVIVYYFTMGILVTTLGVYYKKSALK